MSTQFHDNSKEVKAAIRHKAIIWLHEAAGTLTSQVQQNQRVRTGRTKGSWSYFVKEDELVAYTASDAMNAVYEEFGTGEFALSGDGRIGGWWYKDEKGKFHFTRGKKPLRPLYRAYVMLKDKIIARAQEVFRGM